MTDHGRDNITRNPNRGKYGWGKRKSGDRATVAASRPESRAHERHSFGHCDVSSSAFFNDFRYELQGEEFTFLAFATAEFADLCEGELEDFEGNLFVLRERFGNEQGFLSVIEPIEDCECKEMSFSVLPDKDLKIFALVDDFSGDFRKNQFLVRSKVQFRFLVHMGCVGLQFKKIVPQNNKNARLCVIDTPT
ncbi:MAG: hypothetical protein RLZZ517_328 [Candidatus Parcubacteria bacterium]